MGDKTYFVHNGMQINAFMSPHLKKWRAVSGDAGTAAFLMNSMVARWTYVCHTSCSLGYSSLCSKASMTNIFPPKTQRFEVYAIPET